MLLLSNDVTVKNFVFFSRSRNFFDGVGTDISDTEDKFYTSKVPVKFDLTATLEEISSVEPNGHDILLQKCNRADCCTPNLSKEQPATEEGDKQATNSSFHMPPDSLRGLWSRVDVRRCALENKPSGAAAAASLSSYGAFLWPSHFPPLPSRLLASERIHSIRWTNVNRDGAGRALMQRDWSEKPGNPPTTPLADSALNDSSSAFGSLQARRLEDHLHVQLLLPKITEERVPTIYSVEELDSTFNQSEKREEKMPCFPSDRSGPASLKRKNDCPSKNPVVPPAVHKKTETLNLFLT